MKIGGFDISIKKIGKRSYDASDKGRRAKSLRGAKPTGVNIEISYALQDLRSRSRHMVRNNGWAKRAVEAVVKHTIGEGIRPAPIGNIATNKKIKSIWKQWAETTDCDFYGKTNFYGLQEMAMRSIVEGGDMIVILKRHIPTSPDELPIKLQLCEGDLIDHEQNGINTYELNGVQIKGVARLGLQFNEKGEHVGYWLFNSHPGDIGFYAQGLKASEFYPKEDILHVFELLRIGQARGIPFGVSSFMKMNDFGIYEDAQLAKQKVAACFAAFVEGSEEEIRKEDRAEALEPEIIEYLATGETVTFANPPTVGDYDSYTTKILMGIAAAYGITYEMLTMDYSRVNFTSGRMAKIDVTNNFRSWQYNMIVPQLCHPVWNWFIDACIITGKINVRIDSDWTAPRIQQLDPVKETNARLTAVQAGFTTLSEIIREDGRDTDEFFTEYKQDMDMLKKSGINLASINLIKTNIQNEQEQNQ